MDHKQKNTIVDLDFKEVLMLLIKNVSFILQRITNQF